MLYIRQNATHKVVIGPVVAVGDGFTPVTTLSLASADEKCAILHDNGTVVSISAYTFAAITSADGYYHLTLQSGISGTVGHVTIVINDDSLCLPVKADFTVVEEAVYDMLFAASAIGYVANQPVDVNTIKTQTVTCAAGVTVYPAVGTTTTVKSNQEIVYSTDFATNYNTTQDKWNVNLVDISGSAISLMSAQLGVRVVELASDSITAGVIQDGAIDAATFQAGAITAAAIAADAIGASELAADAVAEIADAVWDELLSGHAISGSAGAGLSAAGSAGDPWSTALPGAYSAGTAGYIVGTNLDGTVSSRASQTSLNTLDDYVDTEVAAIKAKTDNLPSDPADASDIAAAFSTVNSTLSTIAGYLDTEIAAILADTNELQTDWANGGRLDLILDATSTLTQTQVTGGAYALNSASFAFASALDFTTTQKTSIGTAVAASAVASVTGAVGSVTGNVGGNVVGSVGSLATQAKADVNAEVLDVLNVDTLIDGKTISNALKYIAAGVVGRISGAGTGTEVFLGLDEATTRVTVTVDSNGNRTDIVYG